MGQVSERGVPTEPEPVSAFLPPAASDEDLESSVLDEVLAGGEVRSVYQPIVELDTGATVAYEALARGPRGAVLERPDLLFAAARRLGGPGGCLSWIAPARRQPFQVPR